jgi:arylsulfatase A-like enzyme
MQQFRSIGALGASMLCLALASACAADVPKSPPNIVFILADDLGFSDLSCYGSTFHRTPNLDALAKRGMLFRQAYTANPLCSPTRASILTGLYPARLGITAPVCHQPEVRLKPGLSAQARPSQKSLVAESVTRLDTSYVTLAETLRAKGYATGHFGKWHLGREPYSALEHGFDVDVPHWFGPGPAGSYVAPWRFPSELRFQGTPGEHIEDRMATEAAKFIRDNRDRPFFLNYWCFSVHGPWDAKEALVRHYHRAADPAKAQRNVVYAAMIHSLDDAVGTLVKALDENGLTEKTLIVFFSDNGGVNWTGVNYGAAVPSEIAEALSTFRRRAMLPCAAARRASTRAARACRASSSGRAW